LRPMSCDFTGEYPLRWKRDGSGCARNSPGPGRCC
jgi:hypothetical protein